MSDPTTPLVAEATPVAASEQDQIACPADRTLAPHRGTPVRDGGGLR